MMISPVQLNCPKCGAFPAPEDVNVEADSFLCRACSHAGTFSGLVREGDERVLAVVPSRISVSKTMRGLEVNYRRPKGPGFFLLSFALFWNAIVSVFLYAMFSGRPYTLNGVEKTGVDGLALLFMLPFVLVGLAVLPAALYLLFGSVKLILSPGRGELVRGVWGMGGKRRFRLEKDARIVLEDARSPQQDDAGSPKKISVAQPGGKPFRFGAAMIDEEALKYLAAALRQWRR